MLAHSRDDIDDVDENRADPEVDRATLARCTVGDAAALHVFVVHYQAALFRLLSRLLGRGPLVEDVAQETFLRAFRALPGFDLTREARVSTWLLTIGTRLALDVRRRNKIARHHESGLELATIPQQSCPERDSLRAELRDAISSATAKLPVEQRDAFVLSEFHGFSIAEIAEAVGTRASTVKTRLFRARQKLAAALAPYEEKES
jgi:RNA polymerase sigma-70 factor, ECF subfamily